MTRNKTTQLTRREALAAIMGAAGVASLGVRPASAAQPATEAVKSSTPSAAAQSLTVTKDQTTVTITADGRPRLEYRFDGAPFKPYAAQLYSPGGVPVLRDSPADHTHHHALMFAIHVEGANFWEEDEPCGRQVHKRLDGPAASATAAEFTQHLDWTLPDGKAALCEDRTVTVHAAADLPATLLTWRSRLTTPPGKDAVTLTGHIYNGLGARFVATMDKGGEFASAANAPGEVASGDARLVVAKWCAYSAPAGEKPVTVAIFDHPSNARHPARMFRITKPFAYLSATLNLWKEPLQFKAGPPLQLRYGVAAWDGKADAAQIEKLYQRWKQLDF